MRLTEIHIHNFRSLLNITVSLHDYTTLIGPNGAGKSSVLYALQWFFGLRTVGRSDRNYQTESQVISVTVTLSDLNTNQKESFSEFLHEDCVRITKSMDLNTLLETYTGVAKRHPKFDEILQHTRIAEARASYTSLRSELPNLEALNGNYTKDDIRAAFRQYVSNSDNLHSLEVMNNLDAIAAFAPEGPIAKHCKLVFIQGGQDVTSELSTTSRTSLLNELTSSLIDPTRNSTIKEWREANSGILESLKEKTRTHVMEAVETSTQTVNASLQRYDSRAKVVLDTTSPEIDIRYPVSIATKIQVGNGPIENIEDQGHGTQRAVLMAMVEALNANNQLNGSDDNLLKIIAAEEPEIYQHPIRARSFANTLATLSRQPQYQVLIATHSPSFVSTDFVDSLRIMRLRNGKSTVSSACVESIVSARKKSYDEVRKWLDKELPRGIADCFFAELVVIVEGDTDHAVLPEISALGNINFESLGVVCLQVDGKQNIPVFRTVLLSLGLRCFVVADGDYCDDRIDMEESKKRASKTQTTDLVTRLASETMTGYPHYQYGDDTTVFPGVCIYKVDLEHELSHWPSYLKAMQIVNPNGSLKNAHKYRRAVGQSSWEDVPSNLKTLMQTITNLATG